MSLSGRHNIPTMSARPKAPASKLPAAAKRSPSSVSSSSSTSAATRRTSLTRTPSASTISSAATSTAAKRASSSSSLHRAASSSSLQRGSSSSSIPSTRPFLPNAELGSGTTTMSVAVRIRPYVCTSDELPADDPKVLTQNPAFTVHEESNAIEDWSTNQKNSFVYDKVFMPKQTTQEFYGEHYKDRIISAMQGYNVTLFAYGQTGSGKTHTMSGTPETPGVIPLAMKDIFSYIKDHPDSEFILRATYVEIYNERVRDLLDTNLQNVDILVGSDGSVYYRNLREVPVTSEEQVLELLERGNSLRTVAQNHLHEQSSRSHSVFRMIIESRRTKASTGVNVASLNLIDLAGSETAHQNVQTDRRTEGKNINLSLLYLKEVITALSKKKSPASMRNSKLTRILAPSLGGNAYVAVICTVSPAVTHLAQTKKTLDFGCVAKKVQITPKQNTTHENTLLHQYEQEIEALRTQLKNSGGSGGNGATDDELAAMQSELQQSIADMQKAIVTSESLAERLQSAEEEAARKTSQVQQLEKELQDLRVKLQSEEDGKSQAQNNAIEKERMLREMEKVKADLNERLESTKRAKEDAENAANERQGQMQELTDTNATLTTQLNSEEEARAKAEQLAEEKAMELVAMQHKHAQLAHNYKEQELLRQQAEAVIEEREMALSSLTKTNTDLTNQLESQMDARKKAETLANERASDLESIQKQHSRLEDSYKKQQKLRSEAEATLRSRNEQVLTLQSKQSALESKYSEAQRQKEKAEREASEKVEQLNSLSSANDQLAIKLKMAEESKAKSTNELQNYGDLMGVIHTILEEDHKEFEQQLTKHRLTIEELSTLQAKKDGLIEQLCKDAGYNEEQIVDIFSKTGTTYQPGQGHTILPDGLLPPRPAQPQGSPSATPGRQSDPSASPGAMVVADESAALKAEVQKLEDDLRHSENIRLDLLSQLEAAQLQVTEFQVYMQHVRNQAPTNQPQ
eukprot:GFYU01000757.1.p1 GENE.GFYU01000757.1~~GFYU01000757.1.p1  ORF type:complete len:973 (+),score=254.19 GFYU01000757.1:349-3267(+)